MVFNRYISRSGLIYSFFRYLCVIRCKKKFESSDYKIFGAKRAMKQPKNQN